MMGGAGLRRRAAAGGEFGTGCERRGATRPAPSSEVFIRDFGPLAASVLVTTVSATFWTASASAGGARSEMLGRPGFNRGRWIAPGFFRIGRIHILEVCQAL